MESTQRDIHLNRQVCYTIQICAPAMTSCKAGATVEKVNNHLYLRLTRGWDDEGGGGGGGSSQQPGINYVEACEAGSRAGDIYKKPALTRLIANFAEVARSACRGRS